MLSRRALSLLVWMALGPAAVSAQQADLILGRITAEDGRPMMGARIEAMSVLTELTRSAISDRDGRYLITFPDGGGIYVMRVTFLGMREEVFPLVRDAAEDLLLANVTLYMQPISLDEVLVTIVNPSEPGAEPGTETTVLSQDLLSRLPLADQEPETVALLTAGVIGTGTNEATERGQFSVAGMREELNRVTLDGVATGEAVLGVPDAGVARMAVTTSSFDASQGGFAGGQVSIVTARGNNTPSGNFTYTLDSDALQLRGSPTAQAFTKHNIGGAYGGPVFQNRLFYNVSFQVSSQENYRFALAANDPLAAVASGVAPDSIARFLTILERFQGVPLLEQTGAYSQTTGDVRLQGRLDWNITRAPAARGSARWTSRNTAVRRAGTRARYPPT
jgi:hypothetical protein